MDSGNWYTKIEVSPALAHAIIDMDDIGFSEGLGPRINERAEAWYQLVAAAEKIAKRESVARGNDSWRKSRGWDSDKTRWCKAEVEPK